MFKFGLLGKVKSLSLARAHDKPKKMIELELVGRSKSLSLAWLD